MSRVLILVLLTQTFACANVKPWEREILSDPIMSLSGDVEEEVYEMHMHRALSQGLVGTSATGGGCGCEQ